MGSEHTVNGKHYPLEMHMVHIKEEYLKDQKAAYNDEAGFAVIGVFFKIKTGRGRPPTTLETVSMIIENDINEMKINKQYEVYINFSKLISFKKINRDKFYHYMGGFTTPNCDEIAKWIIMKNPLKISKDRMQSFRSLVDMEGEPLVDNYRPTQPVNDREVYYCNKCWEWEWEWRRI